MECSLCLAEGIGVTPWSPLDRGAVDPTVVRTPVTDRAKNDAFAKRIFAEVRRPDKPVVDWIMEVARDHGVPPSQIALAWLLRKPRDHVTIIGATKPQHLEDAVGSLSVKLSDDEVARLEELYEPHAGTEAFPRRAPHPRLRAGAVGMRFLATLTSTVYSVSTIWMIDDLAFCDTNWYASSRRRPVWSRTHPTVGFERDAGGVFEGGRIRRT